MTLRQLEVFSAIVEAGSFTRAAEKLYVAQPSVSQQIHMLEEELGERLLFRMRNRRMYLTEAGRLLKGYADHILRQCEGLRMEIANLSKEPSGEIHIGIGGHRLTSMLAFALHAFHIRFPKIRLDIVNTTTPQTISLLRAGNLDLGVITLPVNATDLRTEKLFSEELIVVVRRSDPLAKGNYITPAQIATLPLVLYDQTTSTRSQLDVFFQREKIAPKVVLELSSVETMEIMVEAGFGATIIPASNVLGTVAQRKLCALRIKGKPPTREVGIVMTQFCRLPRVAEELCRLIRDRFQEIGSQMA